MKVFDSWPCEKCLIRAICTKNCKENIQFYERMIYEFSISPDRIRKRYKFFKGKKMDWILTRNLIHHTRCINSYTQIRLRSSSTRNSKYGPLVNLEKKVSAPLMKLYRREPDVNKKHSV